MKLQQNKEKLRQELKQKHKKMLIKNFGTEHEQIIKEILDVYQAEIRNVDNDGFKFFFELTRQKIHQNRKNTLPKYIDQRSKNIQLVRAIINSQGIVKSDKIEQDTQKKCKKNLKEEKQLQKSKYAQTMKNLKQDLQRDQRQKSVQKQQNKFSNTKKGKLYKSSTPNLKIDQQSLEKSNNFYLQKVEKLVKNLDNEIDKDMNDKLQKQIIAKKQQIRESLSIEQRKGQKKINKISRKLPGMPSVAGAGSGNGTKEIKGTKISITPPPKPLGDIPPKPIIIQPLYVKPSPHKARLQINHFPNFRKLQQQFPVYNIPMTQPRNLNQQVFVNGASASQGGIDGSIVLDGEDTRDLEMTPILQHQRQVTLNTHSIQKLELTHQNNEGIKFALQKLVENIAGLDSLQEELIHKIEAKVEIYESLVQESKNPGVIQLQSLTEFLNIIIE